MVTLHILSYGNGYRPTALGRIDGRPFYVRMSGAGGWAFGVGRDQTVDPEDWGAWFTPDDELQLVTEGKGNTCFHTGSLPWFLEGLERFLRASNASAVEDVLRDATQQAQRLFEA